MRPAPCQLWAHVLRCRWDDGQRVQAVDAVMDCHEVSAAAGGMRSVRLQVG